MKFNLKSTSLTITPAITDYLERKLSDIERFLDSKDSGVRADVELARETQHHRQGDVFRAEINLHTATGRFFAVETESDLYAAIDAVKDEIIREVKSGRKKHVTLLRRGGRAIKDLFRRFYR